MNMVRFSNAIFQFFGLKTKCIDAEVLLIHLHCTGAEISDADFLKQLKIYTLARYY